MSVEDNIIEFLKSRKFVKNASLTETKITKNQNKDGINLFYVRADAFEKHLGINYSNHSVYYAFDMNGNYVGRVGVNVLTPTQVEIEYYANDEYKNKGNITTLAHDVIREIFEEKVFDNLKVRDNLPVSSIASILVAINQDNLTSLAVARKLGFDETDILHIDDYYKQKENNTSIKI